MNYDSFNIKREYLTYITKKEPQDADEIYRAMQKIDQYAIQNGISDCSFFKFPSLKTISILKELTTNNVYFKQKSLEETKAIEKGLDHLLAFTEKLIGSRDVVYKNRNKVVLGDFSFKLGFNGLIRRVIDGFEISYKCLGTDIFLEALDNPKKFYNIIKILNRLDSDKDLYVKYSNFIKLGLKEEISYDEYKTIHSHKNEILSGNFRFKINVEDELSDLINEYEYSYDVLGSDVVSDIKANPQKYCEIIKTLNNLSQEYKEYDICFCNTIKLLNDIPEELRSKPAYGFIISLLNEEEAGCLLKISNMRKINLGLLPDLLNMGMSKECKLISKLYSRCTFNISETICTLTEELQKNEMQKNILVLRSKDYTLDQIGKQYQKTRERVRQIESKARTKFDSWDRKNKLLLKISALLDSKGVLSTSEVSSFIGDYGREITYLLKVADSNYYSYNSAADSFILYDQEIVDKAINFVNDMPEMVGIDSIKSYQDNAFTLMEIEKDLFDFAIQLSYRKTGNVYSKSALSVGRMYLYIIQKYYPDGISVYDDEVMLQFRNRIKDEFDNIDIAANDRAIRARVLDICVMCGKGKYKIKKESYMPNELFSEIVSYINENENSVIIISSIYSKFESELLSYGINNRYYLQGILKEKLQDSFSFTRDYIFKDKNISSFYQQVVDYIKTFNYPITKKQIYENFPGITEIVLSFSVSDENIINLFGEYLHGSKLNLNDDDINYLRETVRNIANDGVSHHGKELYEFVLLDNPTLLNKAGIFHSFSLFSVVEYLFRNEFQFLRPYFAMNDVTIVKLQDVISEFVKSQEKIEIEKITNYAKEIRYLVYSILDLVNSFNNTHLLITSKSIAAIEYIGVTEQMANDIEKMIIKEVDMPTYISNLSCISQFPKLNVPWNEWLIYSILLKWGKETDVAVSNKYFQLAHPIVSIKGNMNLDLLKQDDISFDDEYEYELDDSDNIDDLISDVIEDELFED